MLDQAALLRGLRHGVAVDVAGALSASPSSAAWTAVADPLPFWGMDGSYELETYTTAVSGFPNARRVTLVVAWDEGSTRREYRASTVIAQVDRG